MALYENRFDVLSGLHIDEFDENELVSDIQSEREFIFLENLYKFD